MKLKKNSIQHKAKYDKFNLSNLVIASEMMIMYMVIAVRLLFGFDKGFMLFSFLNIVLMFCALRNILRLKVNFRNNLLFIFVVLILWIMYSFFNSTINITDFVSIFAYVIFPLLLWVLPYSSKKVFELIIALSLIGLPVCGQLFELQFVSLNQADMFNSYAVFVPVSATIIYWVYYYKEKDKKIAVISLFEFFLLYQLVMTGVRGVLLALACLCLFIIYVNIHKHTELRYKIIFLLSLVFICVCILNYENIIIFSYKFCRKNFEVIPGFIIKMHNFIIAGGGLDNSRFELYTYTINKITNSPFLGYGINSLSQLSGQLYEYPHNFILQLFLDGGLIFAGAILVLAVFIVLKTVFGTYMTKNEEAMAVFLLFNNIPKILISGNIWEQNLFWSLIGFASLYFGLRFKKIKEEG